MSVTKLKPKGHQYTLRAPTRAQRAKLPFPTVLESIHFTVMPPTITPALVDLSPMCSPVEEQGPLSSCTGHAFSGAIEYLENYQGDYKPQQGDFFHVSRLFTYYNERVLRNSTGQDAGALIQDGIKVLSTYGFCREELWPYDVSKLTHKPGDDAYADAATRKITKFARVISPDIMAVKQTLASGYPIVCGIQIFDSFEGLEVERTGVVNMPVSGERCHGGHAVLIVGYDDNTQRVKVRNSWGPDWGMGGYFTMPYAYVTNTRLTSDSWVVNK